MECGVSGAAETNYPISGDIFVKHIVNEMIPVVILQNEPISSPFNLQPIKTKFRIWMDYIIIFFNRKKIIVGLYQPVCVWAVPCSLYAS